MKLRRLIDSNLVHDDQVTRRATGRVDDAFGELAQKIAYAQVLRRARHQFVQPGAIAPPRRKVRGDVLSRSVRARGRRLRRLSRAARVAASLFFEARNFASNIRASDVVCSNAFSNLSRISIDSRLDLASLAASSRPSSLTRACSVIRSALAAAALFIASTFARTNSRAPPHIAPVPLATFHEGFESLLSSPLPPPLSRVYVYPHRSDRRRRKSSWKFPPKLRSQKISRTLSGVAPDVGVAGASATAPARRWTFSLPPARSGESNRSPSTGVRGAR